MKLPVSFVLLFAFLTLCLPFAALGTVLPAQVPAASAAAKELPAAPAASAAAKELPAAPTAPTAPAASPAPQQEATPFAAVDSFRILNLSTGKVQKVKRADYVRGAVCSEMPPTFHTQALTAQAVAANTYALRCHLAQQKKADPALKGADFAADPQNWKGYVTQAQAKERYGNYFSLYWEKIANAADMGSQYVLTYQEEPIVAAYHSMSGGQTEFASNVWSGSAPYLLPAESFGDTLAPGYESRVCFSAEEVKALLQAEDPSLVLGKACDKWLQVTSRSESGYVLLLLAGNKTISGLDARRIFGLRSSHFEVSCNENTFTFVVQGYGHGVGLSQYGSDYLARQGASFAQILKHYYTGCTLQRVQ